MKLPINKKTPEQQQQGVISSHKNNHFATQNQRLSYAFSEAPKTMLQVSFETGILRANICRYIKEWREQNSIFLIKKNICPVSKHRAGFYSTHKGYSCYGG